MGLLGKATIALVIYSGLVHGWAAYAGVYFDVNLESGTIVAGYLGKINWSLFPLWWLFLATLVYLSWTPFIAAWRDLQAKGMLRNRAGNTAGADDVSVLCARLGRYRAGLLVVALVASAAITYFDTANLRNLFQCYGQSSIEFKSVPPARGDGPNTIVARAGSPVCSDVETCPDCQAAIAALGDNPEIDFNKAALVKPAGNGAHSFSSLSPKHNGWFNVATYFQQIAAGTLAILAVLQLALLCNLFWRLERAAWLNPEGLELRLDPYSKLHEFGLESWNHALNNVYWVFSLVLLVPLASRYTQAGEGLDFGQLVLQFVVPGVIAMPMLATIIARQQRQRDLWPQIVAEEDTDKVELYHRQRLWPLDRNWASKLGIVISFILLSYLLGRNFNLMSLAGG